MTLVDLQILVKGCTKTSFETRGCTQKEFAFLQVFCHLKLLLNNLFNVTFAISSATFYERLIKTVIKFFAVKHDLCISQARKLSVNLCMSRNLVF